MLVFVPKFLQTTTTINAHHASKNGASNKVKQTTTTKGVAHGNAQRTFTPRHATQNENDGGACVLLVIENNSCMSRANALVGEGGRQAAVVNTVTHPGR